MKRNILGLFGAMALMSDTSAFTGEAPTNKTRPVDIEANRMKIIPAGCKEYYFNSEGQWDTQDNRQHRITRDQTVFITVASSSKSAEKKFDKWKEKNHPEYDSPF